MSGAGETAVCRDFAGVCVWRLLVMEKYGDCSLSLYSIPRLYRFFHYLLHLLTAIPPRVRHSAAVTPIRLWIRSVLQQPLNPLDRARHRRKQDRKPWHHIPALIPLIDVRSRLDPQLHDRNAAPIVLARHVNRRLVQVHTLRMRPRCAM